MNLNDAYFRFGAGDWTPNMRSTYNLYDPVVRSTVQVRKLEKVFVNLDMIFLGFYRFRSLSLLKNSRTVWILMKFNYDRWLGLPGRMDGGLCILRQSRNVELTFTGVEALVLGSRALHSGL